MKILSKITGKTIDTEKYFNPSDYETADPKSVTVIFGPRNIGKTTAYLKDVIKIIESGGQFIWLRNTPTEANTTWAEISEMLPGTERRGHEGAIYYLNTASGRFDKNKSVVVGAVCSFEQLRFWRSSTILKNLVYMFWDELITKESYERPIPNIFYSFIEHLKTIERNKKKFKIIMFTNKQQMCCDLTWKLKMRFKNINEFQECQNVIDGIPINGFWLPKFEIPSQLQQKSLADSLSKLDTATNDYLTNGIALNDNSQDLYDPDEISNLKYLYGFENFTEKFYVGEDKNGIMVIVNENSKILCDVIYSLNSFSFKGIPITGDKIRNFANLMAKLNLAKKLKFDSEYSRNWAENFVNSYADVFSK